MLQLKLNSPVEVLPTLFLGKGITEDNFIHFTKVLANFRQGINEQESEEHQKNNIATFLEDLFYKPDFQINTRHRTDLAIHVGKTDKERVGVLIECKKTTNKAEMISEQKPISKALLELILYYFEEREKHQNFEIKHLIITNSHEWYVFKERIFDKFFYQNIALKRLYTQGKTSDFFYTEAGKILENLDTEIEATRIDFRQTFTETEAVAVYKLLSPAYLLSNESIHDSNTLNREFYNELLHILGLEEVKDGGKILINRIQNPHERQDGSLIENTIFILENRDRLQYVAELENYGETRLEQIESIALELCITWLNRILFLKLLEGQLISYHSHEEDNTGLGRFLTSKNLADFDQINELFFDVLAKKTQERTPLLKEKYAIVPYLNSSLFELTPLEKQSIDISALKNHAELAYFSQTVLRQDNNKRKVGKVRSLPYLLSFLDAYNFAKEGKTLIKKETKTLINAAVLGLIFEKLNGYQDGSFFTPSHITMFMCREIVRKAVVQKFNEAKGWKCETIEDIYNKLDLNTKEDYFACNKIINSIRICDPAVGSGHFLVSVLNELIIIKSELRILIHPNSLRLRDYNLTTDNDELVIRHKYFGNEFEYNLNIEESQTIQETLFYEKKALIENCLFGVDINPKSVHICRLRLWIELLKNAFYKVPVDKNTPRELETLPNLDINIKAGNSLVSRFSMRENMLNNGTNKQILEKYKLDVATYKTFIGDSTSKGKLRNMIDEAKSKFKTSMAKTNPLLVQLRKLEDELFQKSTVKLLDVALTTKQKEQEKIAIEKINTKIEEIKKQIELKNNNPIYRKSLEWRFEFPEILDEEGNFIGFDVVIGNPPYFAISRKPYLAYLKDDYQTFHATSDIYVLFYELACKIAKRGGVIGFITSNKWMRANYGQTLRKFLAEETNLLKLVDFNGSKIFSEASVDTNILIYQNTPNPNIELKAISIKNLKGMENQIQEIFDKEAIIMQDLNEKGWKISNDLEYELKNKIELKGTPLRDWNIAIYFGIKTGFNQAFIISEEIKNDLLQQDARNQDIIKPLLRGRNIRKYAYQSENLYLIHTHNGIKDKKILPIDVVNDYPTIFNYLQKFQSDLETRQDKGNHWTNLRNCVYFDLLEKPKIIYPDIAQGLNFVLDRNNYFINNTAYFLDTDNLYLLALLNSKVLNFYYNYVTVQLGSQAQRAFTIYIEQLPIPKISPEAQEPFIALVGKIMGLKEQNPQADTSTLEREIDELVCTLYELTEEEKTLVLGF